MPESYIIRPLSEREAENTPLAKARDFIARRAEEQGLYAAAASVRAGLCDDRSDLQRSVAYWTAKDGSK